MNPLTKPKLSSKTFAKGAKALVVHDAAETIVSDPSKISSLTLNTTVLTSSPVAGAETTTFLAPALMCKPAFSDDVNRPVDSKTTSTPNLPQGKSDGSF